MHITKQTLRCQLRQTRIAISPSDRMQSIRCIQNNIFKILTKQTLRIAVYESMGSEVSLQNFIKTASKLYPKIIFYRPVYYKFNKKMWFIPIQHHKTDKKMYAQQLDIILIPVLGIDFQGNRLGQGGGYYDASLKHVLLRNKPKKIAIGFDCQLTTFIPHDQHDIKMNTFISEKRILLFRQ